MGAAYAHFSKMVFENKGMTKHGHWGKTDYEIVLEKLNKELDDARAMLNEVTTSEPEK